MTLFERLANAKPGELVKISRKEFRNLGRTKNKAIEQQKENDMGGQEEPSREAYPINALHEVKNLMEELSGRVSELGSRISSILHPFPITKAEPAEVDVPVSNPPQRSPVMNAIGDLNSDVREAIMAVEYLLERLDL